MAIGWPTCPPRSARVVWNPVPKNGYEKGTTKEIAYVYRCTTVTYQIHHDSCRDSGLRHSALPEGRRGTTQGRLWKAAAEFAPDPNRRESDGGNPASEARKFNNHINIQNCGRLPDRQVADLVDDQERSHSLPFSLAVPACSVSLPSPYSNSLAAPCLTYIGREGRSAVMICSGVCRFLPILTSSLKSISSKTCRPSGPNLGARAPSGSILPSYPSPHRKLLSN